MTNASRAVLGSIALAASLLSGLVRGEEPSYEFDLELLSSELGVTLTSADVERLTQASLAGHHTYDIVVNGVFMQRLGVDISFTPEGVTPCDAAVSGRARTAAALGDASGIRQEASHGEDRLDRARHSGRGCRR